MTGEPQDELLDRDWAQEWESLPEAPALVARPASSQITLRVPPSLLARIKQVATARSLPYHAAARSWLIDGVRSGRTQELRAGAGAVDEANAKQLNIKLDQQVLDEIKTVADRLRRPYHRLARELIESAVAEEEDRLGLSDAGSAKSAKVSPLAARPGFATRQDLLRWADIANSKHELPRLVRRLVLETGGGVTKADFPASEAVTSGGWDGIVVATSNELFVPSGLSLWELSAGKAATTKANQDYENRTSTHDGSPTELATYCELIVRPWADRRRWATNKTKDKRWKTVRALGVDDLDTWLECAPITHAWFSELIGLEPYGLRTPDVWWEAWASATEPCLTRDVVLAGRLEPAEKLRKRLTGNACVTTLRADSLDEGLAFIAAVMLQDGAEEDDALSARTVFVDEVLAWRSLAEHRRPLVLVARTAEVIAEAHAAPEHYVIVPLVGTADADVELEPVDVSLATKALEQSGLEEKPADEAARLGRQSLLALRRHLARKPELHTPPWAKQPAERPVRGVLLAGSWDDNYPGDEEQLTLLTGKPYEHLRERLTELAAAEDPFVTRVDNTWAVVSPFDAWRQLRTQVRPDDLGRLSDMLMRVLLEPDPTYGLSVEERWRASTDGKVRQHSGDLRSGLAATLALLGVFGADVDAGSGGTGSGLAKGLVRALLSEANGDGSGERWAALADHLPAIAEAAPDAFLEGVRQGSAGQDPTLSRVFTDSTESDPLFGPVSPHNGLLWALERVAWSPDHFAQTVYLLARLAELDPNGRFMTRPFNTLSSIFCPWYPQTTASIKRRVEVIDELRARHANVAWRLMLALLPELYAAQFPISVPRFRDWPTRNGGATRSEWQEFVEALLGRLIEDAATDPGRWQQLIVKGSQLAPTERSEIRRALDAHIHDDTLATEGREELWHALRDLTARHREFSDADWALPSEEVGALEGIQRRLTPESAVDRQAWLFEEHMPDLGDASKTKKGAYDHEGYASALGARRVLAVKDILAAAGWQGIVELAGRAVVPWMVGDALAQIDEGEHLARCLELLNSSDEHAHALATSYLARRFAVGGWAWLDPLLEDEALSAAQKAQLLLQTNAYPRSWERADELGEEVAIEYWARFSPLGLGEYSQVSETATRLLRASRPAAACRLLTMYVFREEKAPGDLAPLAADALEALLSCDATEPELRALQQYDYESAFNYLERHRAIVGAPRLARLEWAFLPALGHEPSVPALEAALADEPSFFVEVLSAVYRGHSEQARDLTERDRQVATNAYRLLSSWTRPPGSTADGSIDRQALQRWIDTVLPLLDQADRRLVGGIHIGHVLAFAPSDPDGMWPCIEVRDVLERIELQTVDEGLQTQLYNNRGATTRHPEAGGAQERDLVTRYRDTARQFNDRWPRTAAILRSVASSFEQDAGRHDIDAERLRRGMDR
jgi:predicted DNA binding CopG/RHH family protein